MTHSDTKRPERPRPRILLVEDEAGVRRSLQLMLQARGLDVRSYASASAVFADPAALEALCLVTDYRLGDHDGVALVKALRARGWTAPAVLITAYPSAQVTAESREAGITMILEKPFHEHALVDTVLRCVGGLAGEDRIAGGR